MQCYFCHKELKLTDRVGRQEPCPFCEKDLHICKNCEFYDVSAYNECREPQADRVVEKERANFCDYFVFSERAFGGGAVDPAAEAKKRLAQLFKK